ncbi:hypothetical protein QQF64_011753 [Cirrhinus molitorella]|uniref:Uncharacterized protein n=1 Tax=Cirrhinus molitorella TaxID=172907 RepID=A0ABR3LTH7_9TELE
MSVLPHHYRSGHPLTVSVDSLLTSPYRILPFGYFSHFFDTFAWITDLKMHSQLLDEFIHGYPSVKWRIVLIATAVSWSRLIIEKESSR